MKSSKQKWNEVMSFNFFPNFDKFWQMACTYQVLRQLDHPNRNNKVHRSQISIAAL